MWPDLERSIDDDVVLPLDLEPDRTTGDMLSELVDGVRRMERRLDGVRPFDRPLEHLKLAVRTLSEAPKEDLPEMLRVLQVMIHRTGSRYLQGLDWPGKSAGAPPVKIRQVQSLDELA